MVLKVRVPNLAFGKKLPNEVPAFHVQKIEIDPVQISRLIAGGAVKLRRLAGNRKSGPCSYY